MLFLERGALIVVGTEFFLAFDVLFALFDLDLLGLEESSLWSAIIEEFMLFLF